MRESKIVADDKGDECDCVEAAALALISHKKDGIDWVVYLTYPSNGTDFVVEARGESESAVLRQSTKDFNFYATGQRYVKVIAGYRAREAGNYKSSRQAWANSLRLVYYAPFEPRGPSGPR